MDVFLARQPIFGLQGEVTAYELLYRRTAMSRYADGDDSNRMSLDVVIQSFLEVGLDRITLGSQGFINFGREMLLEGCYDLLDPDSIVVELLEDVAADDEVIAACANLVDSGYRLALDDFIFGGPQEVLLQYADIVKVDVLTRSPEEIGRAIEPLRKRSVKLLAEKVETAEMHEQCKKLGFELFQGYFYARPELLANRGVSVEQASMINLMNLLGDESASDQDVEEGFRRDASLSYKLLRMLNTAAHGGRGIESIKYAIRLLGRGSLQRWISLLLASSFAGRGGTDAELVNTAVLRGRFCEQLGMSAGKIGNADTLFLIGLFSLMDSLLRTPMEEVLSRVDLAHQVRQALILREGPYADYLKLVEAYEAGEFEKVTQLAPRVGLSTVEIPAIYLRSADWAREQVVRPSPAAADSR